MKLQTWITRIDGVFLVCEWF